MALSLLGVVAAYLIGAIPVGVVVSRLSGAWTLAARQRQYRRDQRAAHARPRGGGGDPSRRHRQGLRRDSGGLWAADPSVGAARWRRWWETAGPCSSGSAAARAWPPGWAPSSVPRPWRCCPPRGSGCSSPRPAATSPSPPSSPASAWSPRSGVRLRALVVAGAAVVTIVIVWRHQQNIQRLRAGTESRLGHGSRRRERLPRRDPRRHPGRGQLGDRARHPPRSSRCARAPRARDAALAREIRETGENRRYLPGFSLAARGAATGDAADAPRGSGLVVLASVPVRPGDDGAAHRARARRDHRVRHQGDGARSGAAHVGAARRAGAGASHRRALRSLLSRVRSPSAGPPRWWHSRAAGGGARRPGRLAGPALRIYTNRDVLGVELGGALKNVIAIAAGLSTASRWARTRGRR